MGQHLNSRGLQVLLLLLHILVHVLLQHIDIYAWISKQGALHHRLLHLLNNILTEFVQVVIGELVHGVLLGLVDQSAVVQVQFGLELRVVQ